MGVIANNELFDSDVGTQTNKISNFNYKIKDNKIGYWSNSNNKEILFWIDPKINNNENRSYQNTINQMNKFILSVFTNVNECISKLKYINFVKTFIIISGSISKDFFIEFEKVIGEIKVNPIIIIFTSSKKVKLIKKNIISLNKHSLYNINLVFDNFNQVKHQLLLVNNYQIHTRDTFINYIGKNNCFTFEYVSDSKDLNFPLTMTEHIEIPNKSEISDFNHFLLDKY